MIAWRMSSHKKLILILVLLLSFFVNVWGIGWGLPSNRGWAPDEILPSNVLSGIEARFSAGWHEKYPPFHYYVLALLYSPILILGKLGVLDANDFSTYTLLFYAGRLLSVIMGVGIVFITFLCGREILDEAGAILSALIAAMMAPLVYYSKTVNLEVPYIFWVVLSLLFFLRILKYHNLKDYLLFSTSAVCAVCTKDQAYGFYVLIPLFIVLSYHSSRREHGEKLRLIESLLDRRFLLSSVWALLLFLILHNVLFNADGFLSHFELTTALGRGYGVYENSFQGHLEMFRQSVSHVRFSLGWPAFCACLAGLVTAFWDRKKSGLLLWILVPGISYYIFFINVVRYNYVRFLIPLCVVLALFGGALLSRFLAPRRKLHGLRVSFVGVLFAYTFSYCLSVDLLMVNDSRYFAEEWIKENIDPDSPVGIVGPRRYLPRMPGLQVTRMQVTEEDFDRKRPDYFIMTDRFRRGELIRRAPDSTYLTTEDLMRLGYRLALQYQYQPRWKLLSYEGIDTNLNKINPVIEIFKRIR